MILCKPEENLKCPHCGEEQDDIARDYIVPGRIGESSCASDSCCDCGEEFTACLHADGFMIAVY